MKAFGAIDTESYLCLNQTLLEHEQNHQVD